MEDRWIAVQANSVYLGITKDTVYNLLSEKNLSAYKVGWLWNFKKEDVDVCVKNQANTNKR